MLWAVRYGEYQILGSTFYRGISNRVQNLPKNCILKSILSSISWLFFLSFFEVWWHHFRKISIRDFGMNFISCFLCNPDDWCFANPFLLSSALFKLRKPVTASAGSTRGYIICFEIFSALKNKMQQLFLHYNVAMDTVCTSLIEISEEMDQFLCILI